MAASADDGSILSIGDEMPGYAKADVRTVILVVDRPDAVSVSASLAGAEGAMPGSLDGPSTGSSDTSKPCPAT